MQRFALGESFSRFKWDFHFKTFPSLKPLGDWLCSLQVAEAVRQVQVGGSGSTSAEDGDRPGQDEVYTPTLQVLTLQQ